jgi:hypothetical protein
MKFSVAKLLLSFLASYAVVGVHGATSTVTFDSKLRELLNIEGTAAVSASGTEYHALFKSNPDEDHFTTLSKLIELGYEEKNELAPVLTEAWIQAYWLSNPEDIIRQLGDLVEAGGINTFCEMVKRGFVWIPKEVSNIELLLKDPAAFSKLPDEKMNEVIQGLFALSKPGNGVLERAQTYMNRLILSQLEAHRVLKAKIVEALNALPTENLKAFICTWLADHTDQLKANFKGKILEWNLDGRMPGMPAFLKRAFPEEYNTSDEALPIVSRDFYEMLMAMEAEKQLQIKDGFLAFAKTMENAEYNRLNVIGAKAKQALIESMGSDTYLAISPTQISTIGPYKKLLTPREDNSVEKIEEWLEKMVSSILADLKDAATADSGSSMRAYGLDLLEVLLKFWIQSSTTGLGKDLKCHPPFKMLSQAISVLKNSEAADRIADSYMGLLGLSKPGWLSPNAYTKAYNATRSFISEPDRTKEEAETLREVMTTNYKAGADTPMFMQLIQTWAVNVEESPEDIGSVVDFEPTVEEVPPLEALVIPDISGDTKEKTDAGSITLTTLITPVVDEAANDWFDKLPQHGIIVAAVLVLIALIAVLFVRRKAAGSNVTPLA